MFEEMKQAVTDWSSDGQVGDYLLKLLRRRRSTARG